MNHFCHLCDSGDFTLYPAYSSLKRVTSDCKPWPAGGKLGVCNACSTIQVVTDDQWRNEIAEIYKNYTIYYQSGGVEQPVFDQASGAASARSHRLISKISQNAYLSAEKGRLLDFGCGNGGFLKSFNQFFPRWLLAGLEYSDKYTDLVKSIPGVEDHFTGKVEDIPGKFNAISLIHVLEHIESPSGLIDSIRGKLVEGGFLLVELPYYFENPFELLIADHASHFDPWSVGKLIQRAGFVIDTIQTNWIPKELSLVARNLNTGSLFELKSIPSIVPSLLEWLIEVVGNAKRIADSSSQFGLFGTSIAATWLYGELKEKVSFFVDEDSNRCGKSHFGLPVYSPEEVLAGSDVYVVLPPNVSRQVATRLGTQRSSWHMVPAMDGRLSL